LTIKFSISKYLIFRQWKFIK